VLTMHDVVQVAEAQRRFPNWILWLLVGVMALWVIGSVVDAFPWQGSGNAPAVQQEQQIQIGPAPVENPPAQSESSEPGTGATAPVAWPIVQVEWTLVPDLSVLPPVEQGFYNGTMANAPYGSSGTAEWGAYAREILPELLGPFPGAKQAASVARDPMDKEVILAGLALGLPPTGDPSARLFLSVDGEKSWREIQLPAGRFEGAVVLPWAVRVVSRDDSIILFVLTGGGGDNKWHQATLPR
jgi:hypothetical protein